MESLRNADLVITTYHTLASDYSNAKGLLNQVEWYRLVLDEGQYLDYSMILLSDQSSAHHSTAEHGSQPDRSRYPREVQMVPNRHPDSESAGGHWLIVRLSANQPFA